MDDVLILSCTAGLDIGLITRATAPLSQDVAAESIVNTYTTTAMSNDARRAQMPMSGEGMSDTSPIGMTLDLSSKELAKRPIAGDDEIEDSGSPLPALMLLDNEGRLSGWWVVYDQAIRQKAAYPGLTSVQTSTPAMQSGAFGTSNASTTPASAAPATQATPNFGNSTFGQPSRPAFGAASTPGFGGVSSIGTKASPWGTSATQTSSAFGKPAFGATSGLGGSSGSTGFGAASGIGQRASPWGTSTQQQASGGTFGQPSAPFGSATSGSSGFAKLGSAGGSTFGAPSAESKPSQSPFASFASNKPAASPFSNLGGNDQNKQSPFASFGQQNNKPAGSAPQPSFGSTITLPSTNGGSFGAPSAYGGSSIFGTPAQKQDSAFSREATMTDEEAPAPTQQPQQPAERPSGFAGFKLGSGFQGDGSGKDDLPRTKESDSSLFGSGFGAALGDATNQPATPIKREPGTEEPSLHDISTTPASPPKAAPVLAPVPEDAPLPPDFTKAPVVEQKADELPALPSFGRAVEKASEPETAPLPPDFMLSLIHI